MAPSISPAASTITLVDSSTHSIYGSTETLVPSTIYPGIIKAHVDHSNKFQDHQLRDQRPSHQTQQLPPTDNTSPSRLSWWQRLKIENEERKKNEKQYVTSQQAKLITGYGESSKTKRMTLSAEVAFLAEGMDPELDWQGSAHAKELVEIANRKDKEKAERRGWK